MRINQIFPRKSYFSNTNNCRFLYWSIELLELNRMFVTSFQWFHSRLEIKDINTAKNYTIFAKLLNQARPQNTSKQPKTLANNLKLPANNHKLPNRSFFNFFVNWERVGAWQMGVFLFYLGFSFTHIHKSQRTTGERAGHFFNSSLPLPPASETLRHYHLTYVNKHQDLTSLCNYFYKRLPWIRGPLF